MSSIENTAESMTPSLSKLWNKAQMLLNFSKSLSSTIKQLKEPTTAQSPQSAINPNNNGFDNVANYNDINFTGQYSDIAYSNFFNNNTVSSAQIKELCKNDPQLYNNVMKSYNQAVVDGNLTVETNSNDVYFSLTNQGRQKIQSDTFLQQFEKDQKNHFCNKTQRNTACINLSGAKSDINIFRYVDSFNINSVSADSATKSKIKQMMLEWEKYGFVQKDNTGTITPTNKCLEFFKQEDLKGKGSVSTTLPVEKVSPDNLKKVTSTIKSNATEISKNTATVVKTSSTATANATKTAATAGGVATAGVTTAAVAVVEVSKKGIDFMKNNINYKQNITK